MDTIQIDTWQSYVSQNGIAPITQLEKECWASWLAASETSLAGRADIFVQGQLCVFSGLGLLATLSTNQIQWDGVPETLPTWDQVAGDPTTYEHTYEPMGNTVCLMSMNVSELGRGKQLPKLLIAQLLGNAAANGTEHVIGSFRPSEYSKAVLEVAGGGQSPLTFENYCAMTNEAGQPVDGWLRALTKNGMVPLAADHHAMEIPITAEEFQELKHPDWQIIATPNGEAWWCGETGFFYPQAHGTFVYKESNLWGSLYEK